MDVEDSQDMRWNVDKDDEDNDDDEDSSEQSSEEGEDIVVSDVAGCSKEQDDSMDEDFGPLNEALLTEIELVLKGSSEVNCTNALALNKVMQEKLVMVREKMLQLLECVKKRYTSNEEKLKKIVKGKPKGIGQRGAYLKGSTFYFKGNMFFKDINCRNCPNNPDYIHRSEAEGEMFPMDFELRARHVWSIKDKVSVVKGIKEQVLDYLDRRQDKERKPKTDVKKQIDLHTLNLAKLWESVDSDFEIDWNLVAAHDVKHRHSFHSCNAMWNVYLEPSLKRTAWTAAENERLMQAARRYNYEDWSSIAAEVGNRSNYQCFINFYNNNAFSQENKKNIKWTKEQDNKLLALVKSYTMNGVINWNAVCSRMPNRNKVHITSRYLYSLDPKISREPFTPEEDLTLLAAVEEYGDNFGCIPRSLFPNRSSAQLRGRYRNTLMNRGKIKGWSTEDNQKLMDFVAEHGQSSWTKCAEVLGHHSRISCRTRFLTITNFLKKNPNATIKDIPCKTRKADNDITTDNWVEKIAELGKDPMNFNSKSKTKPKRDRKYKESESQEEEEEETEVGWQPKNSIQEVKVENTQEKPRKRRRKKIKLANRLRSIELEMYHFFKYSYNFKLGSDVCSKPITKPDSLIMVEKACGFQVPFLKPFLSDFTLPHSIAKSCQLLLTQPRTSEHKVNLQGYRLPPNWSTLMGFRALCVQSAQTVMVLPTENTTNLEEVQAVHIFRQRLRVLFYKTGLLSRLSPRCIHKIDTRLKSHLLGISELFHNIGKSPSQTALVEYQQQQKRPAPQKLQKEKTKKTAKKRQRKKVAPHPTEPCSKIAKLSEPAKTSEKILQFKIEPNFE